MRTASQLARPQVTPSCMLVITGSFDTVSREEIKDIIRENGGNISSTVSKKTNYLVLGSNPGSKYEKAIKMGIKNISFKEFKKLIY